jgi:hypothetical protein
MNELLAAYRGYRGFRTVPSVRTFGTMLNWWERAHRGRLPQSADHGSCIRFYLLLPGLGGVVLVAAGGSTGPHLTAT